MRSTSPRVPTNHYSHPISKSPGRWSGFARYLLVLLTILTLLALPAGAAVGSPNGSSLQATLQPLIEAKMKALRVPGVVVLVQDRGEGTWKAALGTGDLATGAPMLLDDHFRIASITKTFTGTVILQLVDEGKIRLDDPVAKYQPEVPNGANITIHEMLNMTSGLYSFDEDKGFKETNDAEPEKAWAPKELLAIAFKHAPYFAPGTSYHYSNTNFILLGLIIEQLTGKPVEQAYQQRIWEPLGMTETSLPNSPAIPTPHPHGYMYGTNAKPPPSPPLSGEQAAKVNAAAGPPHDVTDISPSRGWTGFGAISTLHDLNIWAKALATGTLLSPATQRERLSWILTGPTEPKYYGLGIRDYAGFIGHTGILPGFNSFMGYRPDKDAKIIVLTNLTMAPSGTEPAEAILDVIREHIK